MELKGLDISLTFTFQNISGEVQDMSSCTSLSAQMYLQNDTENVLCEFHYPTETDIEPIDLTDAANGNISLIIPANKTIDAELNSNYIFEFAWLKDGMKDGVKFLYDAFDGFKSSEKL